MPPPAQDIETLKLYLGRPRGTYTASAWYKGGSTLGGRPQWIQELAFPDCPACTTAMDYVGMACGADLYEHGEGAYYGFIHAPCRLVAVEYQQS